MLGTVLLRVLQLVVEQRTRIEVHPAIRAQEGARRRVEGGQQRDQAYREERTEVERILVEIAAGDEVERTVQLRGKAQFLLERVALRVASRVEQGLERLARVGARQTLLLFAVTGDGLDFTDPNVECLGEIHAGGINAMALVHPNVFVVRDERAEHVLLAGELDAREPEQRQQVAGGALVHARRRIGTVTHQFHDAVGAVAVIRLPQQLRFGRKHILATEMTAGTRYCRVHFRWRTRPSRNAEQAPQRNVVREGRRFLVVRIVAIVLVGDGSDTQGEGFTQWQVQRDLHRVEAGAVLVLADTDLGIRRILAEHRLLGGERNDAARGVLAEQGALRTAIHLDLLQVEQRNELRGDVAKGEFVHQEADGCVLRHEDDVGAGTAHAAAGGVEARGSGQHQSGSDGAEGADVIDLRAAEFGGTDGGNGNGHILRGFGSLGTRHDHFFELSGLFRGGRCLRMGCTGENQGDGCRNSGADR